MAIDSAAKRFSVMNLGTVPTSPLFPPDSSVDEGDQYHLLNLYSGITLDGTPAAPEAPAAARGSGASGRFYTWTPDDQPKVRDYVRQYQKTAEDIELERLLKIAVRKEQAAERARIAKKIAKEAGRKVTSVQDIARASQQVSREIITLQQTHKLTQKAAQDRLERLKDEEDIILSILLSEI